MVQVWKFRTSILPLLLGMFTATAFSQPPAQGPPPPRANDPRSETMAAIINTVLQGIQKTVDSTNAHIARDANSTGVEAHVGFSVTVGKPTMMTTQRITSPNENVIWNNFIVSYDVSGIRYHGVPYFGRKLGQTIDVYTRCQNWFTNHGALVAAASIQRAYLDGESFSEEALNFFIANTLADYVDSKLRSSLPGSGGGRPDTISLVPCACLGVDPGSPEKNYTDGSILFSVPGRQIVVVDVAHRQAVATLKSVKRLQARVNGAVYYQTSEDIRVEVYINQTLHSLELLAMKEGDDRPVTFPAVTFPKPANDGSVVVIGNVIQENNFTMDSQFMAFLKAQNFGNGTQKLVVRKSYWVPAQRLPDGHMSKPYQSFVDAYELTFQIDIPSDINVIER